MTEKIAIAVEGDVKASAGTTPFQPADDGEWTAGPVTETACTNVASDGRKGLFSATCIFTFVGTQSTPNGPVPVSGSETVNLDASASALTSKGAVLLLDSDKAADDYGNTLEVFASQDKLKTSR